MAFTRGEFLRRTALFAAGAVAGGGASVVGGERANLLLFPWDRDKNRTVVNEQKAQDYAQALSRRLTENNGRQYVLVSLYGLMPEDRRVLSNYVAQKYPQQAKPGSFEVRRNYEFFFSGYRFKNAQGRLIPQHDTQGIPTITDGEMDAIRSWSNQNDRLVSLREYRDYAEMPRDFTFRAPGQGSILATVTFREDVIPKDHFTFVYVRQAATKVWQLETAVGVSNVVVSDGRTKRGVWDTLGRFIFINMDTFDPKRPYPRDGGRASANFDRGRPTFDRLGVLVVDVDGQPVVSSFFTMPHWGSSHFLSALNPAPAPKR